ncbi:MAG: c-type cytochrome [Steroidobacteraceae bacterium]
MKGPAIALWLLGSLLLSVNAHAGDVQAAGRERIERGRGFYEICGACHGAYAEGTRASAAPPLAGQQPDYMLRQLRHFQSGLRGMEGDNEGRQMRQILRDVPLEKDWLDVIAYVKTLSLRRQSDPVEGSVVRGRELYGQCAACHGTRGEGSTTLEAPSLAMLPAWYIDAQLLKFRASLRGNNAEQDGPGSRMRAIASTLQSDQDVASVSAYIQQELSDNSK